MKRIWLFSIKTYISVGVFFYFRRIKIHGIKNIPINKPVLILSNHQNALLDALLIAVKCNRSAYFLTRASVFKNAGIARILRSLQMLPVYRVRDGWSNLVGNTTVFETCAKLLEKNECIVIFPEGNHSLKRMVRPLSKGFTRIVFSAFEKNAELDLQLLPVGLNYLQAEKFADSASIYFGKPIPAKNFISDDRKDSVLAMKTEIYTDISGLTTNIAKANYQDTLNTLEKLNVNFLNASQVNTCIASGFVNCKSKKTETYPIIKSGLKVLLILMFILPYLIWKFMVKPNIKEPEFVSTFRFAMAITLGPLWLICIGVFLAIALGWQITAYFVLTSICLTLLAIKL